MLRPINDVVGVTDESGKDLGKASLSPTMKLPLCS